jgi:porphobilinogen synthase
MPFPVTRPRRLRQTPAIRALVRETALDPGDLIYPLFFSATAKEPRPIATMPGIAQLPVGSAGGEAREAVSLGLGGVLLFGLPKTKDGTGSSAYDPDGPVPRAIAALKEAAPELLVIADVCVDEYTDHGHCGILKKGRRGQMEVDNDATLEVLAKAAVTYARAGADVVAPSDMMDGRVGRIRAALDAEGFVETAIFRTRSSTPRASTAPFARRPTARRSSATGPATRWIQATRARPCAKLCSTKRREPTF